MAEQRPLSERAIEASKRVDDELEQRRAEQRARAERDRAERAERHYAEKVAPVLAERLGTSADEWNIAQHQSDSMTVTHRDEPDLALCVFGPGHVRLAYQSTDGRWHAWNSGPMVRSLAELGRALRDRERPHESVEVVAADG